MLLPSNKERSFIVLEVPQLGWPQCLDGSLAFIFDSDLGGVDQRMNTNIMGGPIQMQEQTQVEAEIQGMS